MLLLNAASFFLIYAASFSPKARLPSQCAALRQAGRWEPHPPHVEHPPPSWVAVSPCSSLPLECFERRVQPKSLPMTATLPQGRQEAALANVRLDPATVSHDTALRGLVSTAKGVKDPLKTSFLEPVARMGAGG